MDFAKTILNSLDPNSEEFAALSQNIDVAEVALKEFENEVVKTTDKQVKMRTELANIKEEMDSHDSPCAATNPPVSPCAADIKASKCFVKD